MSVTNDGDFIEYRDGTGELIARYPVGTFIALDNGTIDAVAFGPDGVREYHGSDGDRIDTLTGVQRSVVPVPVVESGEDEEREDTGTGEHPPRPPRATR